MPKSQLNIRINNGANIAMGPGKSELLILIQQHGSISAAAKCMKMSYRRAWELVDEMNKSFDQPIVISSIGGNHGGGAQITDFGKLILKSYQDVLHKSQKACDKELAFITSHLKKLE